MSDAKHWIEIFSLKCGVGPMILYDKLDLKFWFHKFYFLIFLPNMKSKDVIVAWKKNLLPNKQLSFCAFTDIFIYIYICYRDLRIHILIQELMLVKPSAIVSFKINIGRFLENIRSAAQNTGIWYRICAPADRYWLCWLKGSLHWEFTDFAHLSWWTWSCIELMMY